MKEYLYFNYDGKSSRDFGLISIQSKSGMFEETFLSSVTINEQKIRGRSKPYFQGVERSPFSFKLELAFENGWPDDRTIREVARWLRQDYYKEFYFEENPSVRVFCMPVEEIGIIHNGLKQGYLTLTMRCNDFCFYSPEYASQVYDFSDNPIQYTETTQSDFNQGNLSNVVSDVDNSLKLAKEGTDLVYTIDSTNDWDTKGSHNHTRSFNGNLELDYQIPPGTPFNKTVSSQTDFEDVNAQRTNIDSSSSPGDILISKEGTDKSGYVDSDWLTATGSNPYQVEYVNGNVQLAYQIQPGTAFSKTETTQADFENASAQRSGVDTATSPGDIILAKEGSNVSGSEDTQSQWATGSHAGTTATTTGTGQLELAKEGTDWNSSTDNTWDSGAQSFGGTTYATDGTNPAGLLKLAISGTNFSRIDTLQSDFNGGSTTNVNINSGGYLELSNLPIYNDKFFFTNGFEGSWYASGSISGNTQVGVKTIKLIGQNGASTGLRLDNYFTSFASGATVDFRAKTYQDTTSLYVSISTTQGFIFTIPNTNNAWAWFRVRIPAGATSSTTTYIYQNGTQIGTGQWSTSFASAQVYFYKGTGSVTNSTCYIDSVYLARSDLGPMPASYSGQYISNTLDISTVKYANTSTVSWSTSVPSNDTDNSQTAIVEFQLGTWNGSSVTWDGTWSQAATGGAIPGITKGTDYTNKRLRYRVTLSTTDPGVSPNFDSITMSITSGYNPSGQYVSTEKYTGPQGVKKAARTVIDWVIQSQPSGTSVLIETNLSLDNGSTWLGWKTPTKGGAIPDITQTTDLSQARFKFRVTLTTSDVNVTPVVDKVTYDMYTGYKSSGTRESSVINISSVGKASSTSFSWTTNGTNPSGTTVTADVALSTDGGATWSSWTQVTNGGSIPGITQSTDLSNARLKYRFNLSTTDINYTPNVDSVTYSLTTGYKASGTYTSPVFDVSNVNKVVDSLISWSANTPTNTSVVVEARTSDDGGNTWSAWSAATNGSTIPGLGSGTVTPSGKRLQYRVILNTSNTSVTPTYYGTTLSITPTAGERYTTGYRESPIINISQVGKARDSVISWVGNAPAGTTIDVQVKFSFDGGTTWTPYQSVTNGGKILGIDQSTDLSNARFRYKIAFTTQSGTTVTPYVDRIDYTFYTGYKTTASWISPAYDISNVSKVVSSSISWNATTPTNTSATVDVRLSTDNGATWGNWITCTNGGSISVIPANTVTANSKLQFRVTLNTSDTNYTPAFNDLTISITPTAGERYQSGYYITNPINISQAQKAGRAIVDWNGTVPITGTVILQASTSFDGGTTWSDWQVIGDNSQIPEIEQTRSLNNALVKLKVNLYSDVIAGTVPQVDNLILNVTSGYKPVGVRTTPAINIGSAGTIYSSLISWNADTPQNTKIKIEVSLDGGSTWQEATNGKPIPGLEDMKKVPSNASILIKETLIADDTYYSPKLNDLSIVIEKGFTVENIGDLEFGPEMWIQKIEDGDVEIINRDTGEIFKFTGLTDGETVYVHNEDEVIETDLPGVYRYSNFNDGYLIMSLGHNRFQVKGKCRIQLKYRLKLLR